MLKKVLSAAVSAALILGMSCGILIPQISDPIQSSAETSVYDFDYGPGITWGVDDELPTFAEITATKENPMDAYVANSIMRQSVNTLYSNTSTEVKYAMVTLQGLVNRTRPQIIMMTDPQEGIDTWPKEIVGEGLYKKTTDYVYMVNKYKSYVKGIIVYNEDVPDTMNVASSIAGATDCIVANTALANELKTKCGLSIKLNFNNIASIVDNISAYNYLYNNYYKTGLLNKRLIMGLNPTSHVALNRDLVVATKSAVLWLEPNNANQAEVLDKFYSEATTGVTYNLGWWPQEDTGICYATKKGVATVPSDCFENMTVYMAGSKEFDIPEVPAKPELKNKIYLALAFSDGDNTQYNQHVMKIRWGSSTRQKYPISWTTTPALYYCAPQMLNYYYKTAGNSSLISGPSGMGYTKATRWRYKEGFLPKYASVTNKMLELTGINVITMWDRISEGTYSDFAYKMKALLGAAINNNDFNDADSSWDDAMYKNRRYLKYPENGNVAYKNNIPLLGLGWPFGYCEGQSVRDMENALKDIAKNFDGNSAVFRLSQFVPWSVQTSDIANMAARLEKEYPGVFEFVRADHLFMLMNEYNNVPYNLALQKKATASYTDSGYDASDANDGSFSTGWAASYGNDKWYQIDLGQRSNIKRYVLKKGSTGYHNASEDIKNFTVEYSLNGVDWTTGDTVKNNTDSIVYRDMIVENVRYIRVRMNNSDDSVARIQDLEVYGTAANSASVDELQSYYDASVKYTQGSYSDYVWSAFQTAIKNAKTVLDNANRTDKQIENAYCALVAARKALIHDTPATAIVADSSISLNVNQIYSLNATLTPANTTDFISEWTSSDAKTVTVENGVLTAKKAGNAVITITTNRGLKTQVSVNVKVGVTSVAIDKTSATVEIGSSIKLDAMVLPALATNQRIIWSSSDSSVATVSDGKVTAKKTGTAIITATSADNSSAFKTCKITVVQKPKNGSFKVNGKFVIYKNNKRVSGTKVVTVSGKTYAVVKGYVSTGKGNRLIKIGSKYYVVNKSGIVVKGKANKLVKVGSKSYIVNKQGVVQKGANYKLVKVGKKSYIVNKNGIVQKNKKLKVGKNTYKIDKKGVAVKK